MGEIKKYYHKTVSLGMFSPTPDLTDWTFEYHPTIKRIESIIVGKRSVLALQEQKENITYTLVPGYILRHYSIKTESVETPITEVETIDKKNRKTIISALRKAGFEGPINFW